MAAVLADYKLSKAEILRGIISEKLTTAAQEIFAVVERTVAGYEEEAAGFRQEIDRQGRQLELLLQPRVALRRVDVEDSESPGVFGPAEEEEEEEEEDGEVEEEPVKSAGPHQEDLRDPDYQMTHTRGPAVKRRMWVLLRVCLLEDPRTKMIRKGVLKTSVRVLRCPRGLQEPDFLDLLRSTFPQLTGPFDAFTTDMTRKLTPLKVKTLTPEEVRRSIKSTGRGRSALYIRVKAAVEPVKSEEQHRPLQEEDVESRRRAHPAGHLETSEDGRLSGAAMRRDRRRCETSQPDDGRASAPESEGDMRDYDDEPWDGEDEEEPVKGASPHQEDLRHPNYQMTHTRGPAVKRRMWVLLRVCLLEDPRTKMIAKGVLKTSVRVLRCPRGLQEPDFLDLLRSTFPQLTGPFDAFTTDMTRKLTPLKIKTLTPEEVRRSIKSTGRGRSALYIRVKAAVEPVKSEEQHRPLQEEDDEKRQHAHPAGHLETSEEGLLSGAAMRRDRRRCETSQPDDGRASAAESEGDMRDDDDDDGDEDWKPDEDEEELRKSDTEPKARQVKGSGVKTKRRGRPSLKAPTSDAGVRLSCKACPVLCRSSNMLIKHAWSHVDDPERRCGVCGEPAESADDLRRHLDSHKEIHSCKVCGKSFLTAVNAKRHLLMHTGERPHQCHICHKAYISKNNLKFHQWEHVEDKPHKCNLCNQSFGIAQLLRMHRRTHTGEKPFCCDLCGKSMTNLRSLSVHMLAHAGVKRHGCSVCGKRFLTPAKLKEHEKIHTDRDKMHLCDICCKTFHTLGTLRAHLKTHSNEKVTCSQCGKGLSSHGALRAHMIIHTGERPFKCSKCGRAFNTISILRSHLKTHSGLKPFVCGICGKTSALKKYLTVHMRTHSGERPYQCTVCDKAFTQSHCLKTHMRIHQQDQVHQQDQQDQEDQQDQVHQQDQQDQEAADRLKS